MVTANGRVVMFAVVLAVVLGAGMTLENLEAIKGLTIQSEFS